MSYEVCPYCDLWRKFNKSRTGLLEYMNYELLPRLSVQLSGCGSLVIHPVGSAVEKKKHSPAANESFWTAAHTAFYPNARTCAHEIGAEHYDVINGGFPKVKLYLNSCCFFYRNDFNSEIVKNEV